MVSHPKQCSLNAELLDNFQCFFLQKNSYHMQSCSVVLHSLSHSILLHSSSIIRVVQYCITEIRNFILNFLNYMLH